MEKFKYLSKSKISQLPRTPGVYAFKKDSKKDSRLFYIGKAANIRKRVKNHPELLGLARQLGYIKTESEIEALILEANLIKKYQPKYNVVWRDDKNYFYICITKEVFPRVFITHQPKQYEKYSQTMGPFVDGKALKQTLKNLRKVFPYRSCKTLPKKPCLWFHLGQCPAPCLFQSQRIEAYDVSNIQGQQATGAMITFIKGKPDKNLYRRFKIKIAGKPNDVAMLKEVLQRRFKHPEWGWPDLILIDGGKAQLNAAKEIIKHKIPVMALAKKRNELFVENQKNPILLKNLPREIFNLILQVRDEAHRFARKYHLQLRRKALLG